jgi:hypothetical protein
MAAELLAGHLLVGLRGDLFRYSAGDLNWAFNQDAYFSIDGGASAFNNAGFSTGEVNGDGWQASHWLAPTDALGNYTCALPFVGIMNPYICNGKEDQTTASDLAFFDAIGWNPNVNVLTDPTYAFTTADMYAAFRACAGARNLGDARARLRDLRGDDGAPRPPRRRLIRGGARPGLSPNAGGPAFGRDLALSGRALNLKGRA